MERGGLDDPLAFRAAVASGARPSNPVGNGGVPWLIKGHSQAELPKFVTFDKFKRFVEEGLEQSLLASRNVAFARLLFGSGMRPAEGNHVFVSEVPDRPAVARMGRTPRVTGGVAIVVARRRRSW